MPTELWLNFRDENGETRRILVNKENFLIGRTPENNLQIPLGNLSRQHAKIERFADVFIISDLNSSNGSFLNDERVSSPTALKNGDLINLGGGVDIKIELISDTPVYAKEEIGDEDGEEDSPISENNSSQSVTASGNSGSMSWVFFIIAPVFGLLMLLIIGGGILLLYNNQKEPEIVKKDNDVTFQSQNDDKDFSTKDKEETPEKLDTPTPTSTTAPTATPANSSSFGNTATPQPTQENISVTKPSADVEKIETNSSMCLRRIAQNDPKAFLTGKQVSLLSGKINQFKGSSALAENIRNAKKSSTQIETMARSKNLKPQFLALAALAKLNNNRGDVAATAQEILEVLDNLSIQLGNELANDNLLVIAAYEQGVAGKNLEMRNMLADLANKFPNATSREIRSIWFLKENGKISDSQYELALRFLAIGTIAQNPKDFNVQAEPLGLN